jgi:hypothetical protein
MKLWKNCLAAGLGAAAAAALVPASAQTHVEGVVQPALPASTSASKPVVHAVPLLPPEPDSHPAPKAAEQPAQKAAEKPAVKSAEKKPAEKLAHQPAHKRVREPAHWADSQIAVQPAVPMLPVPPVLPEPAVQAAQQATQQQRYAQPAPPPTPQPYAQPAPQQYAQPAPPTQAYAQPAPTPQPYAQPVPAREPYAQEAPARQPYGQPAGQSVVNWTLQVIRDGQQIDSFNGTSLVGQARTNEHHKVVTHNVGCRDEPAGSIDLQRTITVAPLRADPSGSVLAIQARETVESDTVWQTREGCKLPPQPSQVRAIHPGLVVPEGQWVNWQIVSQDPSLLYRVRASVAPASGQP